MTIDSCAIYGHLPGYPAAWSDCGHYRYALWRIFSPGPPRKIMALIGLNPSIATEEKDDPTVNRCWKLAMREGMDALVMLNAFAFIHTDPAKLYAAEEPVGKENDDYLVRCTSIAAITVAAWGTHGAYRGRGEEVRRLIPHLYCLGMTKHGYPRHPLYLRKDVEIIPYA